MTRFRQVMREVADRGDDQLEMTRAALEARAGQLRSRLEQCQGELDGCRSRADSADYQVDCSRYAQAVTEVTERLERVRRWQQLIDREAGEFGGTAGRFRDLLEADLPRAEGHLLAMVASLEAARRVGGHGS
jgi:hypothetical protein